jgi:hypothetical protein
MKYRKCVLRAFQPTRILTGTISQSYSVCMLQRTFPAGFIAPCLPIKTDRLPSSRDWLHEIKHDGFRLLPARKDRACGSTAAPGNDLTHRFPRIVETLIRLRRRLRTPSSSSLIYKSQFSKRLSMRGSKAPLPFAAHSKYSERFLGGRFCVESAVTRREITYVPHEAFSSRTGIRLVAEYSRVCPGRWWRGRWCWRCRWRRWRGQCRRSKRQQLRRSY